MLSTHVRDEGNHFRSICGSPKNPYLPIPLASWLSQQNKIKRARECFPLETSNPKISKSFHSNLFRTFSVLYQVFPFWECRDQCQKSEFKSEQSRLADGETRMAPRLTQVSSLSPVSYRKANITARCPLWNCLLGGSASLIQPDFGVTYSAKFNDRNLKHPVTTLLTGPVKRNSLKMSSRGHSPNSIGSVNGTRFQIAVSYQNSLTRVAD